MKIEKRFEKEENELEVVNAIDEEVEVEVKKEEVDIAGALTL